jgi:carbonic anhydrase
LSSAKANQGIKDMCEFCLTAKRGAVTRRSALSLTAAAFASGLLIPEAMAAKNTAAKKKAPPKPQNVISPDAALDRLMNGNRRYVKGTTLRHDFAHEREPLSTGQNPFAAVLGCADSRIAPEYCFDTARGDLFVCRVAGNFASDEMVASLEYAVQVLNTPLIMVLGHDACGAVDATIGSVQHGVQLPGHLPSLVAAIKPAVEAAQGQSGDLLANAIRQNVMLNVDKLKNAGPILSAFVGDKKIRVVGGVYQLKTGRVQLLT